MLCYATFMNILYQRKFPFITVFVRRQPGGGAQLVLLDHGLYDYLEETKRVSLCRLYKAIILKDRHIMKHNASQLGVQGKNSYQGIKL